MNSLVGHTGFVGSNISAKAKFDGLYNSKNIEEAFDTKPELLVYSGLRAEKFLANKEPQKDYEAVEKAITNIKNINPKTLVLISTIDVYKNPVDVDEDTVIDTENINPYGLNRYYLEKWVEENIDSHLILRLPGLYGKNIKKNFIFDMINIIPSMLTEKKFNELFKINQVLTNYYTNIHNGFYKCNNLTEGERRELKAYFNSVGFTALNFSDSRASFQFYNLSFLWKHIQYALENNIKKLNISTEPITTGELYKYIKEATFRNEIIDVPMNYNFRTKYSEFLGGKNGYIFNKEFVLNDIKKFMEEYSL